MSARGFTLMEAMIALAIAGIIVAGGATSISVINDRVQDTKKRAAAWDQAKRLQEYVISQMQSAGGGVLRPFQAIDVWNNVADCAARVPAPPGLPPCDGADRIELLKVSVGFPQCRVSGTTGVVLNVDADPITAACCLDGGAFADHYAVLVGDDGTFEELYLQTLTGGCGINAPAGKARNPPGGPSAAPGTLIAVEHQMLYVDQGTKRLWMWRDADGDRDVDPIERTALFDGVYDLQVAEGYDGNPADGREVDDASDTDEWRYNHPLDPSFGAAAFLPITEDQLRMLQVAVTVAVKARLGENVPSQILDGPPLPAVANLFYVSTSSKAYLRNVNIFTQ
jgi:prepilin-type N-terminal cleavage/methylation domain-containing protein